MNAKIASVLVFFFFLATLMAYLIVDANLYPYGKSEHNVLKHSLPLGLSLDYWSTDVCFPMKGLIIQNKNGIVIVGRYESFLFANDTIVVNRIIKYGVAKNNLLVLVEDVEKDNYFIECKRSASFEYSEKIEINVWSKDVSFDGNYQWTDVMANEEEIANLVAMRSGLLLLTIIAIGIFIFYLAIKKHLSL